MSFVDKIRLSDWVYLDANQCAENQRPAQSGILK